MHVLSANPRPYTGDNLLRKFVPYADSVTVTFFAYGFREESRRRARLSCTGIILQADSERTLGLTAEHCTEAIKDFRPESYAVDGLEVLRVSGTGQLDLAIWEMAPGRDSVKVPLATDWQVGDRVFVSCIRSYQKGSKREYTTGFIASTGGDYVLGPLSDEPLGDIVHNAPVLHGCSGGGIFLYNEQREQFELLGITTAFSVFGALSYGSSIPRDILLLASQIPATPSQADEASALFSNWHELDQSLRERWLELWRANSSYRIGLSGEVNFVLHVSDEIFGIGPFSVVLADISNSKLRLTGSLQEIDWRDYRLGDNAN